MPDEEENKKERENENSEILKIPFEEVIKENEQTLKKQGVEGINNLIISRLFPSSSAGKMALIEQLNEQRRPYLYVYIHKGANGEKMVYIEARNSYILRETLRGMHFHFTREKGNSWVLDRAITPDELKKILNSLAPKTSAIIVEDTSYAGIKKLYDPNLQHDTIQDKELMNYVREKIKAPIKTEEAPANKVKAEPQQVAEQIEIDTPNPQEDIAKLHGAEEPVVDDDNIRIKPEEVKKAEQKLVMPNKSLINKAKRLEEAEAKALKTLSQILQTELVYVHFQKDRLNIAIDKAYDKRQKLKDLGYHYNSATRTWDKKINVNDYEKEIEQLNGIGIGFIMPMGMNPAQAKRELEKAVKSGEKYRNFYKQRNSGGKGRNMQKKQPSRGMEAGI